MFRTSRLKLLDSARSCAHLGAPQACAVEGIVAGIEVMHLLRHTSRAPFPFVKPLALKHAAHLLGVRTRRRSLRFRGNPPRVSPPGCISRNNRHRTPQVLRHPERQACVPTPFLARDPHTVPCPREHRSCLPRARASFMRFSCFINLHVHAQCCQ